MSSSKNFCSFLQGCADASASSGKRVDYVVNSGTQHVVRKQKNSQMIHLILNLLFFVSNDTSHHYVSTSLFIIISSTNLCVHNGAL